MSDDKLKELQELEKKTGGKQSGDSGENRPSGQNDNEEFETRELSLQEIEKIKLKMEKEKTGDIKAPDPIQPELPFGDLATPEPPEPPDEILEEEGVQSDEEALKVKDELPPTPVEQYPELEKFSASARSSMSPITRTLLLVVIVLLAIMLYFMFEKDDVPTVTGTTETTEQQQPALVTEDMQPPEEETTEQTDTATETVEPGDAEPPLPVYEFPDDEFQGVAPMEVRPEGPVISEAGDPEIAAIGDALKIRAAAIDGNKTTTRGGITTTVTSGKFQGFSVVNTYQLKNEDVIKNETVIITPSRGKVVIKENFLDSIRKTDYEKFKKDLNASGVEVIKKEVPEEGIISVQLRVTGMFGKPVNPEFLIGPGSVGSVKLEMSIDEMKSALSSVKYTIVDKRMLQEDTYYNTYKVLDRWNSPLFFVTGKAGKVWGIRVLSEKYKTARGIGLGDTLNKFRIYYLKSEKVTAGSTPGGAPFVSIAGEQSRFFLQGEGLSFKKKVFPGGMKVSDILLGGSPFIK